MRYLFLLLSIFLLSTGCKKSSAEDDKEMPVIVLSSPADNAVVPSGNTVSIAGDVTDNKNIYMIHVHISDYTTGKLLIDIHRYPNSAGYKLAESFTANAGITYQVQVRARDNAANETVVTRMISTN
jgi:type III secretory pathway lipoprotein EscJ